MASYGWGTAHAVEDWLFGEGYRFDFYQAVSLLERIYPYRIPVGEVGAPEREVVRFRSRPSLEFPASAIFDIQPPLNGEPAEMTVNFMGLAGFNGPLPLAYTELVLARAGMKDTALRDFLDIFNHRLISLMHRVRQLHRVGADFRSPEHGGVSPYLFGLSGLGLPSLRGRLETPDRALLLYSGIMVQKPHSMRGLERLLSGYLGTHVRGRQLIGRWLQLDAEQTTAIGATGRNQRLGESVVLGSRVWDQQGKFDLHVGPLDLATLNEFLPGNRLYRRLCELVRLYAGEEFAFDIVLEPAPEAITGTLLDASSGSRLGWTSWLGDGTRTAKPDGTSGTQSAADPVKRGSTQSIQYRLRLSPKTL